MQSRRLGKSAIHVSDICMGTMTFGSQTDEAAAFRILDRCFEAGINFYDTAEGYPVPPDVKWVGRTEEIVGRCGVFGLLCFAFRAWVLTFSDQGAGCFTALAGRFQTGVGVGAQRQALLFAVDAVLQPPPLSTGRRDFEVKAFTVGKLARLRTRLEPFDGRIGEGHIWGQLFGELPPNLAVAPKLAPVNGRLGTENYGRVWNGKSPKYLIYLGLLNFDERLRTTSK